jgi:hypothetical protein
MRDLGLTNRNKIKIKIRRKRERKSGMHESSRCSPSYS